MAVKKKKKKNAKKFVLDVGHPLHRLATFLEQTRLADYMDLMQRPHKLAWLNFWAGVWRGFGIAIGGLVFVALLVYGLKYAVHHAGGLPWIGAEVEKAVSWLLAVIEKKQSGE